MEWVVAHPHCCLEFCFPWPDVSSGSERLNVSEGWDCWKQRKSSFQIVVNGFGLNVLVAGLGEMKPRAFGARRGSLATVFQPGLVAAG